MPWRNPPDIPYTLRPPVALGIPTATGRAPVTFSENEEKSPLIAGRAPAGTRQDAVRVSVKNDLTMTTVPGSRQGLRSQLVQAPSGL